MRNLHGYSIYYKIYTDTLPTVNLDFDLAIHVCRLAIAIAVWVTVVAQLGDGRSSVWVTVVVQWAKAPGIHCYVAGSIPAVTPRYCTKKIEKCSLEHTKKQRKKKISNS